LAYFIRFLLTVLFQKKLLEGTIRSRGSFGFKKNKSIARANFFSPAAGMVVTVFGGAHA
jgi:hypothetical protein